jgi:HEAT repeat protein
MLMPSQVLPFLQHQDKYVRALAIKYFKRTHDPSPATADDVWKMIEAHGPGVYRSETYLALSNLPQTESSIRKTLNALVGASGEGDKILLSEVIGKLPYGVLNRFNDLIENSPAVDEELRKHLAQRFELAPLSPAELWDRLVAHNGKVDDSGEAWNSEFERTSNNLVEALARNPEAAQWAVAALNDRRQWKPVHVDAIKLLGRMRFRPATEMLVGFLNEEEVDSVLEAATDALTEIGSADVVRIAHENYSKLSWGGRLFLVDVLGGIHLPQSEQALTDLLIRENDLPLRTRLGAALCEIAATEPRALERLREILSTGQWEVTLLSLDADVVALFMMVGFNVPELPQLRAALDDEKSRRKAIRKAHQKSLKAYQKADPMRRTVFADEPQEGDDLTWDLDSAIPDHEPSDIVSTIRRSAPKVGRNDPCPCGSGKKYKKCCGK